MNRFLKAQRGVRAVAGVAVFALVAAACGSDASSDLAGSSGQVEGGSGRIQVVASTDVYGSVVSAVGGDRVEVTSLIDNANADPLEYETTAGDAVVVRDARLVVYNGEGYDTFMPPLVEAADGDSIVVEVVALSGLTASGDGEFNEHVFYDLATIEKLADRVAEVLSEVSPSDSSAFTTNADAFKSEITALRTQLADIAAARSGARVAVTEPLPGYLIDEAGLVNATPEEFAEAIEEGDDPSAAAMADMLALFGSDPVDVLILNTQTQSAATDQVREAAADAVIPVVSMSETLTSPDYVTWMDAQIKALADALDAG